MNKEELAYYQMEGRAREIDGPSWEYEDNCSDTYDDVDNFETDLQG